MNEALVLMTDLQMRFEVKKTQCQSYNNIYFSAYPFTSLRDVVIMEPKTICPDLRLLMHTGAAILVCHLVF